VRIAMLSWESLHSTTVGGVAAHVTELAAALARKVHQILVLSRRDFAQASHDWTDDVHCHRCTYPPPRNSRDAGFLRPRLRLDLRNTTRPYAPKESHYGWTRNGRRVTSGKEKRTMLAIASHWTLIIIIIAVVLGIYGYRKMDSR